MFNKVKSVTVLDNYNLLIGFVCGKNKIYDLKPLFEKYENFCLLKNISVLKTAKVDIGGYGVIWGDELDLSCNELWDNGKDYKTAFDNLMSFKEATYLWGLNESTLRKAIVYGKLINNVDVCKFGKQWIITMEAMKREYGEPKFKRE